MTARQGKVLVLVTVLGLTALLARHALDAGDWVSFAVTELQVLVPMTISWWILASPSPRIGERR